MTAPAPPGPIILEDETDTRALAETLAAALKPGDLVTLSGDLGAGKTTFARYLIRALAGDDTLEVPSPTFTLVQLYDLPRGSVVHADLYRLGSAADLSELGWDEAQDGAIVLVEWPERADAVMLADRLDVALALVPEGDASARSAVLTGHGTWAPRLERIIETARFLGETGFGDCRRSYMQGDASSRAYEQLTRDGESYVFMNSPRRPDGPPVKHGLPYSRLARLAEDVVPFVAMAEALRARGFSAPVIHAADLEQGFLVVEDLGREGVIAGSPPAPIDGRYALAVDVLAELHASPVPERIVVAPGIVHHVPPYDLDALAIEIELLPDWYLPHCGLEAPPGLKADLLALWHGVLPLVADLPAAARTWALRDYHSPNLIWLPDRDGLQRIGLIDFQDAVMGADAYDVASLLQDARVTVPEALEITLLGRYVRARKVRDPGFDAAAFAMRYALLGAQRATKILGIFARLNRRDGKPAYLAHLPRVHGYLTRCLAHPVLRDLQAWYEAEVPRP